MSGGGQYNWLKQRRKGGSFSETKDGIKDNLAMDIVIEPETAITSDEYTVMLQTILNIKINGQNILISPVDILKRIQEAKTAEDIKSIQSEPVKFLDENKKAIAEMTPEHCILHQPLNPEVLKAVQECYQTVIVKRCGSLDAALDLKDKMPQVEFSQEALDMITKRVEKNANPEELAKLAEFIRKNTKSDPDPTYFKLKDNRGPH